MSGPAYKHPGRNAYPGVPHRQYPVNTKRSPEAWDSPTVGTARRKQKLDDQQIGVIRVQKKYPWVPLPYTTQDTLIPCAPVLLDLIMELM